MHTRHGTGGAAAALILPCYELCKIQTEGMKGVRENELVGYF